MSLPPIHPWTIDLLLSAVLGGQDLTGAPLDDLALGEIFTEEFLQQCPKHLFAPVRSMSRH